jgi:hypothetical protein
MIGWLLAVPILLCCGVPLLLLLIASRSDHSPDDR